MLPALQYTKHTSLLCSTELPTSRAARSAEATDTAEPNSRQTSVSQTFLFSFPSLSALFKTQAGKGEGEEAQIIFRMKINAVVAKPVSSCRLSSSQYRLSLLGATDCQLRRVEGQEYTGYTTEIQKSSVWEASIIHLHHALGISWAWVKLH